MKNNRVSKYFIRLTVLVAVILNSGCKDFLTEINPNQQTTASFWKTLDDADQGLTGVYNKFKDQNLFGYDINNWSDMTMIGGNGRTATVTNELYLETFTNSTKTVTNFWSSLYNGIFRANQVIAGMKTVTYTNSLAEQNRAKYILGQAYFFRGLFYFYLYNTFNQGSVPIRDVNNMYDLYIKINSAAEVRAFYLNDLDSAYANLPDNWRTSTKDFGRPTKGTAAAVLGQSYLYEKDYATAATYFLDVINNTKYGNTSGYKLVPNIGDNFNVAGELNDESILEICYSMNYLKDQAGGSNNGVATSLARNLSNVGGYRSIIPACWLEMAFREEALDYSDARNMYPDGTFHLYSLRLAKSIACTLDTTSIYYGTKQNMMLTYGNKETSYFKKFTNWETPGVISEDKLLSQSGINFRVIRLADVYLMYAECMMKGGTDDAGLNDALTYINRVRHRSALQLLGPNNSGEFPTADHDNVSYTAQTLMDFLKWKERPMELCLEGYAMRHIDLRRWGGVKDRLTFLSQQIYGFKDFPNMNNATKAKFTNYNATLTRLSAPAVAPAVSVTEFVKAAQVYNSVCDYFPIPADEETGNPNLYK